MKITTTGGSEYYILENCPYCCPNTAGQHDIKCPNYQAINSYMFFPYKLSVSYQNDPHYYQVLKNGS